MPHTLSLHQISHSSAATFTDKHSIRSMTVTNNYKTQDHQIIIKQLHTKHILQYYKDEYVLTLQDTNCDINIFVGT